MFFVIDSATSYYDAVIALHFGASSLLSVFISSLVLCIERSWFAWSARKRLVFKLKLKQVFLCMKADLNETWEATNPARATKAFAAIYSAVFSKK